MSINWNRVAHPGGGTYANPNILKTEQAAKPKAKPKATFARWLNRNGASYDNDIRSQCDLDDFARRAWNAGCRAAGRRSRTKPSCGSLSTCCGK